MHWSHSVSRWFMVDLFCCCLSSPVPCSYTVINKGRRPVEFSSWSICFALFWMLSDMSAWFNFLCPKKMIKKRNCPFLLSQPVAMIRHSSFCLRGKSAKAWRALQWGVSKLKQAAPTFAKCVESKSRTLLNDAKISWNMKATTQADGRGWSGPWSRRICQSFQDLLLLKTTLTAAFTPSSLLHYSVHQIGG